MANAPYDRSGYGWSRTSRKKAMVQSFYTLYNAPSASNDSTLTLTVTKPRKPPEPEPLRAGEPVRAQVEGILHNRRGNVEGFLATPKGRIVFVRWPDGGWSTFLDDQLERVGKKAVDE